MNKKIFIVTGEQSGDLHAGKLVQNIKKINSDIEFYGIGGTYLKQQDVKLFRDIKGMSVMGIFEVLKNIRFFKQLLDNTADYIIKLNPDIVIFVDYPGFNIKLAEKLKNNIKGKLVYYICPQVWVWHTNRVFKMNKLFDKFLVIFRFAEDFFKKYVPENKVSFVGHPLVERIEKHYLKNTDLENRIITLLPGSRVNELKKVLPEMIITCKMFLKKYPDFKIYVSASDSEKISILKHFFNKYNFKNYNIVCGNTYNLLKHTSIAVVASGTATLETALIGVPMVVVYKINYFSALIAKYIVDTDKFAIINIISEKFIVKEFLQDNMKPRLIAKELFKIVEDSEYRQSMIKNFKAIKNKLLIRENEKTAAQHISELISK